MMIRLLLAFVLWIGSINAATAPAMPCDTTIYVDGPTTTENGCATGLEVDRLRLDYGNHFLWVSRGGRTYIVTDPAILRRVGDAYRPQRDLGRQQSELGRQQAALGARQAELGRQQGDLGREQAFAEGESAQRELSRRQDELGRRQDELGHQQDLLGRQQDVLGRKQDEAARAAARRVTTIFDDAIHDGLAREAY